MSTAGKFWKIGFVIALILVVLLTLTSVNLYQKGQKVQTEIAESNVNFATASEETASLQNQFDKTVDFYTKQRDALVEFSNAILYAKIEQVMSIEASFNYNTTEYYAVAESDLGYAVENGGKAKKSFDRMATILESMSFIPDAEKENTAALIKLAKSGSKRSELNVKIQSAFREAIKSLQLQDSDRYSIQLQESNNYVDAANEESKKFNELLKSIDFLQPYLTD